MSNSQVIFNKLIAESLTKAGHDVTMIMIELFPPMAVPITIDERVKVHKVLSHTDLDMDEEAEFIYPDLPMWDSRMRTHLSRMFSGIFNACELTITNQKFMEWLKKEQFDIAFSHMFDLCAVGMIHHAKIPTWIWLNSGAIMDFTADAVGVPIIPSYVSPMMMAAGAQMNFLERVKSFVGHGIMKVIYPKMFPEPETALFRKHIDPNFPDLWELTKQCPLVMVNSNELYELARPTLHKVVNIGGLGMQFRDAKPLKPEFQLIINESKGIILMSFGSVAQIDLMPQSWKKHFMTAFSRFPDYHFIVRYAQKDIENIRPDNVHLFEWIPQNDLLKNEKTIAFISHGGYNSLQETIVSGKPIIAIPLFGDQYKNAKIAKELGFGINIEKASISADVIEKAIREIVQNEKYKKVAKRISEMVNKKPIKPEELLVKWTEFLVEFKTLENFSPYGNNLSFIQYHSIDVIAFLTTLFILFFYIIWRLLKVFLLKLFRATGICKNCCKSKIE